VAVGAEESADPPSVPPGAVDPAPVDVVDEAPGEAEVDEHAAATRATATTAKRTGT
jgi:hypothetical protein